MPLVSFFHHLRLRRAGANEAQRLITDAVDRVSAPEPAVLDDRLSPQDRGAWNDGFDDALRRLRPVGVRSERSYATIALLASYVTVIALLVITNAAIARMQESQRFAAYEHHLLFHAGIPAQRQPSASSGASSLFQPIRWEGVSP